MTKAVGQSHCGQSGFIVWKFKLFLDYVVYTHIYKYIYVSNLTHRSYFGIQLRDEAYNDRKETKLNS